ncbi:unnamed protein product [Sphagnum jensenii]
MSKGCCIIIDKPSKDFDKADVLQPNNAFTLRSRGVVKSRSKEYQGPLQDLDKVDVLEPNNAFTLKSPGHVKRMSLGGP